MIKMTMHGGEEIQQRELPCDLLSLKVVLYQMNIMRSPGEVSVQDVQAEFTSDDPLGQKLIDLIRPSDTLSDVDSAAHQIESAPQTIRSAIRQRLLDGRFETIADIQKSRDQLLKGLCRASQLYYFPISCSLTDEEGILYRTYADVPTCYAGQIRKALEWEQARDIDTMAIFFWCADSKANESIQKKLLTIRWGVEEVCEQLYGRVEVTSTAPFTPLEDAAMKEWINGQNSDGIGEGFERCPTQTDYFDIYVHCWHAGDGYFVLNTEEFQKYLAIQMGEQDSGMDEMSM